MLEQVRHHLDGKEDGKCLKKTAKKLKILHKGSSIKLPAINIRTYNEN